MRILSRVLVVAVLSGCALVGADGGAVLADNEPPSIVESLDYPEADRIFTDHGVRLRKGDGHILFAPDCAAQPDVIRVWSRIRDTEFCFRTLSRSGFLSLELPQAYAIRANSYSLRAAATVDGNTQTVTANPGEWRGIGEGADPNSGPATLLEVRTTHPNPGSGPPTDPAFGFVAKIDVADTRACTGALIAPQWVVTARACFTEDGQPLTAGRPPRPSTVTVGRTVLSGSAGHVAPVVYLAPRGDRDVVLAKLATPVTGIAPLPIATAAPATGETLRVAGFGRTATEWAPDRLHVAGHTVASVTAAAANIVAAPGEPDLCKGDAGGPALREANGRTEIVAIGGLAWQRGCLAETPTQQGSVATRVDDIGAWIQQIAVPDPTLARSGWTATADSQQTGTINHPATNVLDGNSATFWHTQYSPTVAALPHSVTVDMHATAVVTGLRYLPRTDHPNGRVGNYQIHISIDGTTWGNPVAAGTFADDATEKAVAFTPATARFVRLTALTEAGNRGQFTTAAEINLTGQPVPTLSRHGWTVTADSQQTATQPVAHVLDGNPATFWHTEYTPTLAPLPHSLTVDMHATATVTGLRYLPRSDHPNGRIGNYQVHVSTDGTNWGNPVAAGTFADDLTEKTIAFTAITARFVRLTALTEAGNRGPFSSAAEINLTGDPTPDIPRPSWTVTADSQQAGTFPNPVTNVLDGNPTTFWHTQYSPTVATLPHSVSVDMHATATVTGLRYLPRSDHPNGRIGNYQINVSTDGTNWGNPVAAGTFADDLTEKTIAFTAITARFVRLTALTEAGNRGPLSSAAEINITGHVS